MIRCIDYIEFYVSDAFELANFYKEKLDFEIIAFGDSSTGLQGKTSYIVKQGKSILIFTSSTNPHSPVSIYVKKHGNFVRDIAFRVGNLENFYKQLVKKGGPILEAPQKIYEQDKVIIKASIKAFGDVIHSLIERKGKLFNLPFYKFIPSRRHNRFSSIKATDHVAIALEPGTLEEWVSYYKTLFNFRLTHKENVYTGKSGMKSMVVSSQNDSIKFPLVSPMRESPKGQIDIFLEKNNGAGVQHLAFLTDDIINAVKRMRDQKIGFLEIPDTYYEKIKEEATRNISNEIFNHAKNLGILIESEKNSILLQTFTKPFTQTPPFFVEIIERHNHKGFGSKNIKALFESVEKSQNR